MFSVTHVARLLRRPILATLLAAAPTLSTGTLLFAQETADSSAHDILLQFKKATVAIGRPATTPLGAIDHAAMEIVSSGFLYAYTPLELAVGTSTPDEDGTVYHWAQIWVVTAGHAIAGLDDPVVRLNTKTGGTITYPLPKHLWHFHSTEDVAVAPFPSLAGDLDATDRFRLENSEIHTLSRSSVALRPKLAKHGFFEYTPVAIFGFPVGMIEGGRKDYPVVRSGRIAQITGYLEADPGHRTFLVDSSAFPGNSGGPVVIPEGSPSLNGRYRLTGSSVLIGMVSERTFSRLLVGRENADLLKVVTMEAVNETVHNASFADASGQLQHSDPEDG